MRETVLAWLCLLLACEPLERAAPRTGLTTPVLSGQRWVDPDASATREAGAGAPEVLLREPLVAGDRMTARLALPAKDCLLVLGRSDPGLRDVDLVLFGEDGTQLLADELPDASPALLLCPPLPRSAYLLVRAVSGRGLLAVGTELVPLAKAERVRSRLGLLRDGRRSVPTESGFDTSQMLSAHKQALGIPLQTTRLLKLPVDASQPTALSLMIPAGRCVDLLVLPDSGVYGLDLELFDDEGETLGRLGLTDRDRFALLCSRDSALTTLQARPRVGRGYLNVIVSELALSHAPHLATHRLDVGRIGGIEPAALARELLLRQRDYRQVGTILDESGMTGQHFRTAVPATGFCHHFEFFAASPGRGLRARYFSAEGKVLAQANGRDWATLTHCPGSAGWLDVTLAHQGGRLMVTHFTAAAGFAGTHRAARAHSQLVGLLESRGNPAPLVTASQADAVELSPDQPLREGYWLLPGWCLEAIVAVEEIREPLRIALRPVTGQETGMSVRQAGIASAGLCSSPTASTPTEIELTVVTEDNPTRGLLVTVLRDGQEGTDRAPEPDAVPDAHP